MSDTPTPEPSLQTTLEEAVNTAIEGVVAQAAPSIDVKATVTAAFPIAWAAWIDARIRNSPVSVATDAWNHLTAARDDLLAAILKEL